MTYSINNKETICYRRDGLGQGPTIRSIFLADPTFPRRLDAESVRLLLKNSLPPGRTFFAGIGKHDPDPPPDSLDSLNEALLQLSKPEDRRGIAVLSNPIPSPILSVLRRKELDHILAYAPSTFLQSMEHPTLKRIDSSETRLIAAFPDTVSAVEAPFDSLLPVATMLLARAMKRDGIDRVIAILSPETSPCSTAIFHSMGLSVQSYCPATKLEPEPHIDLSCYLQPHSLKRLATELNLLPDLSTPRRQIIWATLHLLHTQMTGPLLKERKKLKKPLF